MIHEMATTPVPGQINNTRPTTATAPPIVVMRPRLLSSTCFHIFAQGPDCASEGDSIHEGMRLLANVVDFPERPAKLPRLLGLRDSKDIGESALLTIRGTRRFDEFLRAPRCLGSVAERRVCCNRSRTSTCIRVRGNSCHDRWRVGSAMVYRGTDRRLVVAPGLPSRHFNSSGFLKRLRRHVPKVKTETSA
jgi:hypothetical protein